jgi:hypothetical protein
MAFLLAWVYQAFVLFGYAVAIGTILSVPIWAACWVGNLAHKYGGFQSDSCDNFMLGTLTLLYIILVVSLLQVLTAMKGGGS